MYIHSLYLSSSSVISKEKLNNVPLKNEDYCILTYFEDFTCLYVGKAMKCGNNGSYSFVDSDTLINTAKSTGKINLYFLLVKSLKQTLEICKFLSFVTGTFSFFSDS